MAQARQPADRDQVREAVRSRYGGLARGPRRRARRSRLRTGRWLRVGGFGARPGTGQPAACPAARCGPTWAAATLSRWPTCVPGRRCWTGSGGGIDVLLSARRVGPAGMAYGLDMTSEMLDLAQANARAARATRCSSAARSRGDPAAGRLGGRDHLQLRDQLVDRPARRVRRVRPGPAARRAAGRLRHPGRRRPHPGAADRPRRPGRLHSRGALLRRVPRRPDPGRVHRRHHHRDPSGRGRLRRDQYAARP